MTEQMLIEAKEFLATQKDGQIKRIVDLDSLRINHSNKEIIEFLKAYLNEKEKSLRNMILIDRTHHKVDEIAASMFRIHMAIRTLENGNSIYLERKEVEKVVKFKRGAEKSCELHRRYSCSDRVPRFGKDKDHDGKDINPCKEIWRSP